MVSSKEIKERLQAKREGSYKGYLLCEKCGGYYELEDYESPEDFSECTCGGKLKYIKNMDELKPPTPEPVVKEDKAGVISQQTNERTDSQGSNIIPIFCTECGAENRPDSVFCFKCGKRFDDMAIGHKRQRAIRIEKYLCPICGAENRPDSVFCFKCGKRFYPQTSYAYEPPKKETSRTLELVLGILGGIFGFLGALFAIFFGSFAGAFEVAGASDIIFYGVVAIFVSITGIVGAVIVYSGSGLMKHNVRWGSIIMIVSGVIGFNVFSWPTYLVDFYWF